MVVGRLHAVQMYGLANILLYKCQSKEEMTDNQEECAVPMPVDQQVFC